MAQESVFQQALNMLSGPEKPATQDLRMQEVKEVLAFAEAREQEARKSAGWRMGAFLGLGVGMLALGVLNFFKPLVASLAGLEDPGSVSILGAVALISMLVLTVQALKDDPLPEIRQRIEKLYSRLNLPTGKYRSKGFFRSTRDSIISGVAGGLAERLDVPANLLRFALLLLIPITGGSIIIAYILLALLLGTPPHEDYA